MSARQRTKAILKEAFPSIWLRWHLMHHPKSAEQELLYLDRIVPEGAVTVDVGADHFVARFREARGGDQAHIPTTNH